MRLNRKRLKGRTGEEDCRVSLSTLYHVKYYLVVWFGASSCSMPLTNLLFVQVLLTTCKVMAPFTPFFTEILFQNLRKVVKGTEESIHYCSYPNAAGKVPFSFYAVFSLFKNVKGGI